MKDKPTRRYFLVYFLVAFILSFLLTPSASSGSLYTPVTSAVYHPPLQSTTGTLILNTIVVPAYHERSNIRPLVTRVFHALSESTAKETEMIIVDDNSEDGTEEEVERLKSEGFDVQLIIRKTATETKGLSSAVLRGFERARGKKLVVMDADLQHPPEYVQPMIDALTPSTPFALGTRYGAGVSVSRDWPLYRRVISWGARLLARPLTSASDPMSGFFGIMKESFLNSQPINTSGFKLALELLLKAPISSYRLAEVPYSFATRTVGQSKLGAKVMLKYVGQLLSLYVWRFGVFWHAFIALGASVTARIVWEIWLSRKSRDNGTLLPLVAGKRKLRAA